MVFRVLRSARSLAVGSRMLKTTMNSSRTFMNTHSQRLVRVKQFNQVRLLSTKSPKSYKNQGFIKEFESEEKLVSTLLGIQSKENLDKDIASLHNGLKDIYDDLDKTNTPEIEGYLKEWEDIVAKFVTELPSKEPGTSIIESYIHKKLLLLSGRIDDPNFEEQKKDLYSRYKSACFARTFPTKDIELEKINIRDFAEKIIKQGAGGGPKNDQQKGPKKDNDKKNDNGPSIKIWEIKPNQLFLAATLISLTIALSMNNGSAQEINFQEFKNNYLSKGFVQKIVIANNKVATVVLNENGKQQHPFGDSAIYFFIGSVESFEHKFAKAQDELEIPLDNRIPVQYVQRGQYLKVLMGLLPTLLMFGGLYWITTRNAPGGGMGGGMFGVGKSKAKRFNQEKDVKIKFDDVAGMAEAKEEVMEFVKFLKDPAKYEKLGAKIPRGAILSGAPGTGKTLLAKATAGEAGVPFYSVSGSEFIEMFVGVGASRVRDLFKVARENAPAIVFVDEIDAIGKARGGKGGMGGGNDERESTLNQLLVEMDGFSSTDHVVVLAGTNRPDVLDQALMRPGRFDRHITIDKPELEGRKEIFAVHLKKITLGKGLEDIQGRLAALTPGFSGADIANVCNEAALIAARKDSEFVELLHFELAIERVIGGIERKTKLLNPEEKKIVAYHEAGHAICGWYLEYADPLLKVSIIPRGQGALGYAQYLPPDIYLLSTQQLKDRMTMTLGGRVSEELNFESVTSGASDDFNKVTSMATAMVVQLGMSPKIGLINYHDSKEESDLTKPYSEHTGSIIDEEISRIIKECHTRCKDLLVEKSKEVTLIGEELLKKEVLTREDMIRILGKRPFPERNDAFDKYLDEKEIKDIKKGNSEMDSQKRQPA